MDSISCCENTADTSTSASFDSSKECAGGGGGADVVRATGALADTGAGGADAEEDADVGPVDGALREGLAGLFPMMN
jgi:hypothetical protein